MAGWLVAQPRGAISNRALPLNEAGIVVVEPPARQRIYRLEEAPFDQIGHWVDSFELLWETRLNSLDRHLDVIARGEEKHT